MKRIALTANLQSVGNELLSIPVPITINNDFDTCIKCLTNTAFMCDGGELIIANNLGSTPTRLLCIKHKRTEEFSVYVYDRPIHLKREFVEMKRKSTNTFGKIAFNSILNLKETISYIKELLSNGVILTES